MTGMPRTGEALETRPRPWHTITSPEWPSPAIGAIDPASARRQPAGLPVRLALTTGKPPWAGLSLFPAAMPATSRQNPNAVRRLLAVLAPASSGAPATSSAAFSRL